MKDSSQNKQPGENEAKKGGEKIPKIIFNILREIKETVAYMKLSQYMKNK